ncbi:RloB family protein [Streptodolium elevatio]
MRGGGYRTRIPQGPPRLQDLQVARTSAKDAGIRLAISNPCFEVWLLLHVADHKAHCGSYGELEPYLKRHIPHYDKTRIRFADYAAGLADARIRAHRLDPSGLEYTKNPTTNVWQLVNRLTDGAKSHLRAQPPSTIT